jgi:hypothetical protein
MAIGSDYPTPIYVNGFQCKNCTDVDFARNHIDPAHPKDGPYGIDATGAAAGGRDTAVTFGGGLSGLGPSTSAPAQPAYQPGSRLNLAT